MPAKGHAKEGSLRRQRKVCFTDREADLVRAHALQAGLKEAPFIRKAVLDAIARKPLPVPTVDDAGDGKVMRLNQAKVLFSDAELVDIDANAEAERMTRAEYMRVATLEKARRTTKVAGKKKKGSDETLAVLYEIRHHLKKIGGNVNQLAHQANTGMVPLTPKQIEYLGNLLQLGVSATIAATERVAC
jgi:hypothetical protein